MKHELLTDEPVLMNVLLEQEVSRRHARELQNVHTLLDYQSFSVDMLTNPCQLCVLTPRLTRAESCALTEQALRRGTTVALIAPYEGRERQAMCRELVEKHTCTSIDKRGYILLFNHPNLPKQHYRI